MCGETIDTHLNISMKSLITPKHHVSRADIDQTIDWCINIYSSGWWLTVAAAGRRINMEKVNNLDASRCAMKSYRGVVMKGF